MNLFSLPDPVGMYESAKDSGLLRAETDALVSAALSGWMAFIWRLGARNLLGLGPALQDLATAQYLTLQKRETKNFLTLTVPQEMLAAGNLSRFETEWKAK